MARKKHQIYQTGTINSLLNAVYDGDMSIGELREHGDFGLGTFDMVDGEMIVCDNVYYRADEDGNLSVVPDDVVTPFAVVNRFQSEKTFEVSDMKCLPLEQWLKTQFESENMIYAIRIDGTFRDIHLRSEHCQPNTLRKLTDTLPALQHTFVHENIAGSLVGVWFPKYLEQLNVPGFHFHFVDADRKVGGHVFDFDLEKGTVHLQVIKSLHFDLIDNAEFAHANLTADTDAIDQVEHLEKKD
jgi:acetolactate decarboxylase